MNYFLDFEAAPSGQIISIGCVSELGETFYTLVKQKLPEQIPPFLTKLTNITNKDLKHAPSLDEACNNFLDFITNSKVKKDELLRKYYVFGNSDKEFLEFSIDLLTDTKAIAGMTAIKESLNNYQKDVKAHFGKEYRLIELYNCLQQSHEVQAHNALLDAIMLKEIFHKLPLIKNPDDYKTQEDRIQAEESELNFSMQKVVYNSGRADKKWLEWSNDFSKRFGVQTDGNKDNYFIKAYFEVHNKTMYFATLKEALLWLMKYAGPGTALSSKRAKNYVNYYYKVKKAVEHKTKFKNAIWTLNKEV